MKAQTARGTPGQVQQNFRARKFSSTPVRLFLLDQFDLEAKRLVVLAGGPKPYG
ncbi:hypothetical protein [Bradyrhizobium lablabi]|uniref:hypothetical protein n=1 Tax=Bradyrhizobium lablabi TaxID=722472 RepID=UPI001BA86055|nr:hypothetical protein [Bradyrhizobium lablabi]MBR0692093.1 hypothetical protein [Bradyrhizobium lablabi]